MYPGQGTPGWELESPLHHHAGVSPPGIGAPVPGIGAPVHTATGQHQAVAAVAAEAAAQQLQRTRDVDYNRIEQDALMKGWVLVFILYKYLILKNYVTIPTISFYDMNAIRAS